MTPEFSGKIFEKYSYHENPYSGSHVIPWGKMDGQTMLIIAFYNSVKVAWNVKQCSWAPIIFTFITCILILSTFFLYTNEYTNDFLKNNITIYIKTDPTCFGAEHTIFREIIIRTC